MLSRLALRPSPLQHGIEKRDCISRPNVIALRSPEAMNLQARWKRVRVDDAAIRLVLFRKLGAKVAAGTQTGVARWLKEEYRHVDVRYRLQYSRA